MNIVFTNTKNFNKSYWKFINNINNKNQNKIIFKVNNIMDKKCKKHNNKFKMKRNGNYSNNKVLYHNINLPNIIITIPDIIIKIKIIIMKNPKIFDLYIFINIF